VQLIYAEPRGGDPRVDVITRGGAATVEDRMTQGKLAEDSGIRKATEKTQAFNAKKERQIFEEARQEFKADQGYLSKTQLEIREYGMPHAFDQSTSPREGKEVSKLMEFLYTCIKLIHDENGVQELQNLIRQYELGKTDPLLNRAVHQIGKKRRTNKELHLNAQIGEYEIKYVVLDLGSEVNVTMKQTWAYMGKPMLIYSPIRLRMDNKQAVSSFGRLEHVPVDIDGVRTFANFEVIEIVDNNFPYPALLGIDWAFDNSTVVELKKRHMTFEKDGLRVITPLDPYEGQRYTKTIREEDYGYALENIYKLTTIQHDYIKPTTDGNLSWRSDNACSSDSEEALENWQNQMYKVSTRRCARFTRIGTTVSNLPTFDGLNPLEAFLLDFEANLPTQHRLLAMDEALKATPTRWWGTHKINITH
jgi:hypothetical protein